MIFMLDMFYNGYMPKLKPDDEKKTFQIGFRINRLQRERLDFIVARVKSQDKRVEASEVYEELMSLKETEFISKEDREYLSGRLKALPELNQTPAGARAGDKMRSRKSIA